MCSRFLIVAILRTVVISIVGLLSVALLLAMVFEKLAVCSTGSLDSTLCGPVYLIYQIGYGIAIYMWLYFAPLFIWLASMYLCIKNLDVLTRPCDAYQTFTRILLKITYVALALHLSLLLVFLVELL